MSIEPTFRPIDVWPGTPTPPGKRKPAPFRSGWSATMDLLHRELRHLSARDVVVQLALTERDIRLDGWPRADARPEHSGVVLAFESKHGPLKYPCDTFTQWKDNLRAIAMALESLRRVDRYGVTRRGEQYRGWKALPGGESPAEAMTVEQAASFIARHHVEALPTSPEMVNSVDAYRSGYRMAARRLHPDSVSGDNSTFVKLQKARAVLDKHHGLKR